MKVKIKLDDGAVMPARAHESDVGYDIRALSVEVSDERFDIAKSQYTTCECACYVVCETGIHVQPEPGYYVEIVPNSRIAKKAYFYGNSIGIIDPEYTGSIKVIFNILPWDTIDNIQPGDVVGQMIIRKYHDAEFELVDDLKDTERGTGGFGSTEKKKEENYESGDCCNCAYRDLTSNQFPCSECCEILGRDRWEQRCSDDEE